MPLYDQYGPTTGTYYPAWQFWVNQGTGYLTPQIQPTASTVGVWDYWITNQTTGSAVIVNPPITNTGATYVWNTWNAPPVYNTPPPKPEITAEQEANRKRRNLILMNQARAMRIRKKLAKQTAELLLVEHLSEAQRREWEQSKAFTVVTADGLREYRIKRGMAGNVTLVKCKEPPMSKYGHPIGIGARFCMHVYHPEGWVPDEDNVLAQKLLLESGGEAEFLAHANVS